MTNQHTNRAPSRTIQGHTTDNRRKRPPDERRPPLRLKTPSTLASESPSVLDAVKDQLGGYWIRYGTKDRSVWFSLAELQQTEGEVLKRLSGPGMTFLTRASKER